jgi:isoquinoline 1-oxidoreductase beta subunit
MSHSGLNKIERINRRDFLQRTGLVSGGLVLALTLPAACKKMDGGESATASFAPNVYVNIRDDGVVQIYCHRSEMGQGIRTCLPQIIADEMDADWNRIEVIQALGDEKYGDQNTDGSTSIRNHFDLLRRAGVTAREMLIGAAAATWNVPSGEITTREHAAHHASSGRSADFGELVEIGRAHV